MKITSFSFFLHIATHVYETYFLASDTLPPSVKKSDKYAFHFFQKEIIIFLQGILTKAAIRNNKEKSKLKDTLIRVLLYREEDNNMVFCYVIYILLLSAQSQSCLIFTQTFLGIKQRKNLARKSSLNNIYSILSSKIPTDAKEGYTL